MCGRLAQADFQLSDVTAKEMSWLYENKMIGKTAPGRGVYDAIRTASPQGRCPLCGHRDVSTVDHYLGLLYSMQAARLISGIQARLDLLLREGASSAVRDHLRQDEESWRQAGLDSWQAACYGVGGKRLILRGRLQVLSSGMSDGAGKVDAINGRGHHECCDFRRGTCQRRTPVHGG